MATRSHNRHLDADLPSVRDARLASRRSFVKSAAVLLSTVGVAPRLVGADTVTNTPRVLGPVTLTRPYQLQVTHHTVRDLGGSSLRDFACSATGANGKR